MRGAGAAVELELLELELLLAPPGASRSRFSAKSLLTSSAIDVVSVDVSVPGELLLFASPLSLEGVKNPLRIVFGGSERGERKRVGKVEKAKKRPMFFCFSSDASLTEKSESKRRAKFVFLSLLLLLLSSSSSLFFFSLRSSLSFFKSKCFLLLFFIAKKSVRESKQGRKTSSNALVFGVVNKKSKFGSDAAAAAAGKKN